MIRSGASAKRRRERSGQPGKLGIIRLYGAGLEELRFECWLRDKEQCQKCHKRLYQQARFPGDPDAYDMAHIVSRGAGGSDTLENVRALCHECHMKEHTEGKRTSNHVGPGERNCK
jgi:5-methylcytosine-specific restriction endonuclease McrA